MILSNATILIEEAEESYEHMIHNYNDMFDDDTIKHFDIRYASPMAIGRADDVKEQFGNEIHKELLLWIHSEHESGRLFKRVNWKPFRDRHTLVDVHLGYYKLFAYKNNYFHLGVETELYECGPECRFCNNGDSSIHFELKLYGWKDDSSDMIHSQNKITILPDNLMPEIDWNNTGLSSEPVVDPYPKVNNIVNSNQQNKGTRINPLESSEPVMNIYRKVANTNGRKKLRATRKVRR